MAALVAVALAAVGAGHREMLAAPDAAFSAAMPESDGCDGGHSAAAAEAPAALRSRAENNPSRRAGIRSSNRVRAPIAIRSAP